jgi:uncharacterized repeat protein (TIGR01451 family)
MLLGAGDINAASGVPAAIAVCDVAEFTQLETRFQEMAKIRAKNPGAISNEAYKAAALAYIAGADDCYHATVPQAAPPTSPPEPVLIDDGGVWFPGFEPSSGDIAGHYVAHGNKWGTPGLGNSGGTVTYSYMANGVSHAAEGRGGNTHLSGLPGFKGCFYTEIDTAFAAWSAVANIQFVKVTDNGVASNGSGAVGDIRIGAHPFDGSYGALAHAYYPPPNGISIAGDLHFDNAETWACTPGGGFDIGIVTLHEIGHSLGLKHEPSPPVGNLAVMNPVYNSSLTGLLADDINGILAIYGSIPLNLGLNSDPFPLQASTMLITYTVSINNNSGVNFTNIPITNTIPSSITYVSGSASNGGDETSPGSRVITWPTTNINSYTTITRTFQVSVTSPITDGDQFINVLSVSAAENAETQTRQFISFINPEIYYIPIIFKFGN